MCVGVGRWVGGHVWMGGYVCTCERKLMVKLVLVKFSKCRFLSLSLYLQCRFTEASDLKTTIDFLVLVG